MPPDRMQMIPQGMKAHQRVMLRLPCSGGALSRRGPLRVAQCAIGTRGRKISVEAFPLDTKECTPMSPSHAQNVPIPYTQMSSWSKTDWELWSEDQGGMCSSRFKGAKFYKVGRFCLHSWLSSKCFCIARDASPLINVFLTNSWW